MKKVIIYQADIDGVYSSVKKVECSKDFADEVINDSYLDYFKTFSEAKKVVLEHVNTQLKYWKEAVEYVKKTKVSEVEIIEMDVK